MQLTQFNKISTREKIDKDAGVIFGVSVITEGPAATHDLTIDSTMLAQVRELGSQFPDGLKVRMNHPQKGSDIPIQSIVGALKNFRIEGQQTRADLHLLKTDENFSKLVEMAEKMPENFGLSVVYSGVSEEKEGKKLARCTEIYATDLVDAPAANPTGLFSKVSASEHTAQERDFSADEIHYGSLAHHAFKTGMNPPGWSVDEGKWGKAKEAALQSYKLGDDAYWPAVVHIYKKMGGTIKGEKAEEKMSLSEKVEGGTNCPHCGEAQHLCSCKAMSEGEDHYSKYGDVSYADSENRKYPIDTEAHVRAALSYINMPKNAEKYSADKLGAVKSKIEAAAKRHGIKISESTKKEESMSKLFAKALGLDENASDETIVTALSQKLAAIPDISKLPKPEDIAPLKDLTALSVKLTATETQLAVLNKAQENGVSLAQKAEIDHLMAEASAQGKVVPFENDELYTVQDGVCSIKMMPTQLAKVISKLTKGTVMLVRKAVELPKNKDGVTFNRRSPEFVQFCRQKQEEGATALEAKFKTMGLN
jgi:type III secretion system FlhB-like substrate exporter